MMNSEILISAGEPSGEMYAARLLEALGRKTGSKFFGLGGNRMRAAGAELIGDASDIAVVGITEVVGRLPAAWRLLRRLQEEARQRHPQLAILVDFPDFNLRLGRRLRQLDIRIIYFISPQVWAWRVGRLKQIRQIVERMIVIFPFEEEFYRRAGVPVDYVGHPLVDSVRATMTRADFQARYRLNSERPMIALLPGSRRSEVAHNLPRILDACHQLRLSPVPEFVLAAAPGLRPQDFAPYLSSSPAVRIVENGTYDCLAAADCAIVSSGTATVEAALLGAPMVVVYRVSRSTAFIVRRLVRSPFISMVNLIVGKAVVPELIQDAFTGERVASEVRRLLSSADARNDLRRDLQEVRTRLRPPGPGNAIERAAEIIANAL